MLNQLLISGRITKDLELKNTSKGGVVLPFDIAVQRNYKNKNGEYESDFVQCLATKGTAEFLAKHAKKGYFVTLTGRIQNNNYTRPDGTTNYGMQMIVGSVDNQSLFMNKNKNQSDDNESYNQNMQTTVQRGQSSQPQQPKNEWQRQNSNPTPPNHNPFANGNTPIDIDDDDLPF